MGTTCTMAGRFPNLKAFHADILQGMTRSGYVLLAHRVTSAGRHLWAVFDHPKPAEYGRTVYLWLCSQHKEGSDHLGRPLYSHCEKSMTAEMGPYYYDCPQSLLDHITGPVTDPSAAAWYAKVHKYPRLSLDNK